MQPDLVEFLRARLDDDEAVARAAEGRVDELMGWIEVGIPEAERHVYRHDSARVLAEVDAKRRIVDGQADADPHSGYITATFTAEDALRLLALPYADHPDYDESWRSA